MFEVIGIISVWTLGLLISALGPMLVGMIVSDRRRDDGMAAYASIPVGIILMGSYMIVTLIYFVAT